MEQNRDPSLAPSPASASASSSGVVLSSLVDALGSSEASAAARQRADRGSTGFSWSAAVRNRRDRVLAGGLRVWLLVAAGLVVSRTLISLSRPTHASVVPLPVEAALGVTTVAAALTLSLRPPERGMTNRMAAAQAGGVAVASAASLSSGALHPGFGTEVLHSVILVLMISLPMLLPLPTRLGLAILALVAAIYPVSLLATGVAGATDPLFAAQVVDLSAGFGMAALMLVMHNLLFAGRWAALRDLARLAERDALTGVLNRRTIMDRLGSETKRSERHGSGLAVLICDIDRFKQFNSRHGYAVGDQTLRVVADALNRVFESEEFAPLAGSFGRYGGEEFVALIPAADHETARRLAERCRAAVDAIRIPTANGELGVSISIGFASTDRGTPAAALLPAADQALYLAKTAGGNRCVAAAVDSAPAPAGSAVGRRPSARTIVTGAHTALLHDTRAIHGIVLRWVFAVTAAWAGLLGLMDLAFVIDGRYSLDLAQLFAGRALLVSMLAALAVFSRRMPWWNERLTLLHACFVLSIASGIIWLMEQTGGLQSPYFTQLVYLIAGWALAFSVRPGVSVVVLAGVTLSVPLYYVGFEGLPPTSHSVLIRTAVLIGAGTIALATQSVFRGLRAEEVGARHRLDRLARLDPLTGLPNRVAFEERLDRQMLRAGETAPLSLVLLDLDHFKRINDTVGHVGGDHALVVVSTVLEDTVRTSDLACRLGGEEFAVVLPMTDLAGAMLSAERLRRAIGAVELADLTLSASFGVTEWRPGDTVESMMARADAALRTAKASGRNTVRSDG